MPSVVGNNNIIEANQS